MAIGKHTFTERIEALHTKQKNLKEQEKRLKARQSNEERKKRTKRLIEVGATVEGVFGRAIEKEDLPKLASFLEAQDKRGNYFTDWMNKATPI